MGPITFKTTLVRIGPWTVLKVPQAASDKLPSRGLNLVEGTLDGARLHAPLQPDGAGGHWLRIEAPGLRAGDTVEVVMSRSKSWPEPQVPADVKRALKADAAARAVWEDTTPLARWEWLRWIGSTKSADTRAIRIEKTASKLKGGTRTPCCFNRNECTEPAVSHRGVLLDPTEA